MKIAIISIGNPLKRDDNIANIVLSRLQKMESAKNRLFVRAEMNPENFIFKIEKFDPSKIFIIDAISFGGKIGEVRLFNLKDVGERASTHSIPLTMLSKFFGKKRISIIGIQPKAISYGTRISSELKRKMNKIISKVKKLTKLTYR